MARIIRYEDIEEGIFDDYLLIDSRSPSEFKGGSIPGAINIPLFTDEDRAELDKEKPETAMRTGIQKISSKLTYMYDRVMDLSNTYKHLVFFCNYGGMRSSSISSFFEAVGINAIKLEGGYMAYRNHILDNLPKLIENVKFALLYGQIGQGDNGISKKLEDQDMDVIDFQGIAKNKESVEILVYDSLINKKSNFIFVEGESKLLYKDIIPDYLWEVMDKGIHIKLVGGEIENSNEEMITINIDDWDKALDQLNKIKYQDK